MYRAGNGILLFLTLQASIYIKMPTISIWDLFFVKNALYFSLFIILNMPPLWLKNKKSFIFYIHRTILLKIKICLMIFPLKFVLFLWKNDVLSFIDNDISTLIVEGATTCKLRHNFLLWRKSWNIQIIILLLRKNSLLFCGMFEKYPIFLSGLWLITKRVVAVARRVVAAALLVVVVARQVVVVAWPMMRSCRRLPTHSH